MVRFDISFNGNKTEISRILTENMDLDQITRNLKRWRIQALYEFEWIVPLYETFELIISDFNNIINFTSDIMSWINDSNYTLPSNNNLDYGKNDSNRTTIPSIEDFFGSLYDIFDGFDLFFGNRREIPYVLNQFIISFEQMEIFQKNLQ